MTRILTVLILASLTIGQVGCGCHRPFLSWFNRGDSCETCAPPACPPAGAIVPGTAMLGPSINDQLFGNEMVVGSPIVTDGPPIGARVIPQRYEEMPRPLGR